MLKKIISVFAGILISFAILELSLQTAGFLVSKYHELKNNSALKNKTEYKIMCLGESTTYMAYPEELQKILNQKYPDKFTVIDCGIPAIKLDAVLRNLDKNIRQYKPDIAICMMGINNTFVSFDGAKEYEDTKYKRLKIYRLYKLITANLTLFFDPDRVYAQETEKLNIDYVYELYLEKKYSSAAGVCEKIIETKKDDYIINSFLAMLYFYHLNKKDAACRTAADIIENNRPVSSYWKQVMYEIAIENAVKTRKDSAIAKKYIEQLVNDSNVIFSESLYNGVRDFMTYDEKRKFLKKMYFYKTALDHYYGLLAIESSDKKDYKKAEEYFRTAEELRLKYPNETTYGLYKLIIKKLTDNNVKVICMQYPVRSIEPLKQMLKNEQYYGRIEFLSNEGNFKNLLKEKQFFEIFSDQFAGDFGHYKKEGSVLIAENVTGIIEKVLR